MELQKTTKAKLIEEYKTGDPYNQIVERLTKEGLGRVHHGIMKEWCQSSLSNMLCGMGYRRNKLAEEKITEKKTDKKKSLLNLIKTTLETDAFAAEDRMQMVLLMIDSSSR